MNETDDALAWFMLGAALTSSNRVFLAGKYKRDEVNYKSEPVEIIIDEG